MKTYTNKTNIDHIPDGEYVGEMWESTVIFTHNGTRFKFKATEKPGDYDYDCIIDIQGNIATIKIIDTATGKDVNILTRKTIDKTFTFFDGDDMNDNVDETYLDDLFNMYSKLTFSNFITGINDVNIFNCEEDSDLYLVIFSEDRKIVFYNQESNVSHIVKEMINISGWDSIYYIDTLEKTITRQHTR